MKERRGRLVYSTGSEGSLSERRAPAEAEAVGGTQDRKLVVRRERSGRKGKTVTVVTPVLLGRAEAAELLTVLKKKLGCGGSVKPGRAPDGKACLELELQGDRREAVVAELGARGFRASPG